MRKVDSDRIQSFHMQALRRILGIRWYDKASNAVGLVNERTKLPQLVSYCWQTSFIIWSHLSPTGEHTCFAGTATVNRSPHRHSSRRWLEAPTGSSTKKLAATSGRRHWPICWCSPNRGPGSFDVEDATTLSWSSVAVSESEWANRRTINSFLEKELALLSEPSWQDQQECTQINNEKARSFWRQRKYCK